RGDAHRGPAATKRQADPPTNTHPQTPAGPRPDVVDSRTRAKAGPPLPDGLASDERVEAGDQRRHVLAGIHARLVLSCDPVVLLVLRSVAMARHVDRQGSEATLRYEAARPGQDSGRLLVLPAAVSHQDQRTWTWG